MAYCPIRSCLAISCVTKEGAEREQGCKAGSGLVREDDIFAHPVGMNNCVQCSSAHAGRVRARAARKTGYIWLGAMGSG